VIESLVVEKPLDVLCTCSKMQEGWSVISITRVMRPFLAFLGGTNNLCEFFFHLFQVTMNKHSENAGSRNSSRVLAISVALLIN